MRRVVTTRYALPAIKRQAQATLRIALVADLHNEPCDAVLAILRNERPDMIAVPGDLMTQADALDPNCNGLTFLRAAAKIAPVFYSLGNHEPPANTKDARYGLLSYVFVQTVRETGAILLDNAYAAFQGLTVGGLTSVGSMETKSNRLDPAWLRSFAAMPGSKLLLCHNPEYYPKYIKPLRDAGNESILLVLSGHAHGGQWRMGKRGFFAPGQGFFPHYVGGVYDQRLVVSRGLSNTLGPPLFPRPLPVPRLGNPMEVIIIDLAF